MKTIIITDDFSIKLATKFSNNERIFIDFTLFISNPISANNLILYIDPFKKPIKLEKFIELCKKYISNKVIISTKSNIKECSDLILFDPKFTIIEQPFFYDYLENNLIIYKPPNKYFLPKFLKEGCFAISIESYLILLRKLIDDNRSGLIIAGKFFSGNDIVQKSKNLQTNFGGYYENNTFDSNLFKISTINKQPTIEIKDNWLDKSESIFLANYPLTFCK